MASPRQGDLFQSDEQPELYDDESQTPTCYPDRDKIRAELHRILAEAPPDLGEALGLGTDEGHAGEVFSGRHKAAPSGGAARISAAHRLDGNLDQARHWAEQALSAAVNFAPP